MANPKVFWGLALLPLFAAFLLFAPMWLFAIVVYAAIAIGLWEFHTFVPPNHSPRSRGVGIVTGMAVAFAFYFGSLSVVTLAVVSALVIYLVFGLFFEKDLERSLAWIGKSCLGMLYVGVLSSFLLLLRDLQDSQQISWTILLFLVVWINDAGAYFTGRKYGKHKLFERVSPKKTIEGSLGGLAASIVSVPLWKLIAGVSVMPWTDALLIGLILGIIGPVGDLVESMLKRAAGVKDSGNLIPGHGGILDRVDSIIFAAPFLYFFVLFRYVNDMM